MNASQHSARNGPRRRFTTAIAIAGMIVGLTSATAAPPLANEQVTVPKSSENTGQKIGQNTSPGAVSASANQGNAIGHQFDAATTFNGDANLNTIAKLANNNGVTDVVAVSNDKAEFNSGSDTAYVAPSAATMNTVPLDTSPNSAVVGRNTAENGQQVNSEGGVGYGARLVANFSGSSVWTDLGAQATACNA